MIYFAEDHPTHWAFRNWAYVSLGGQRRLAAIMAIKVTPSGVAWVELMFVGVEGTRTYTAPQHIRTIRAAFVEAAAREGRSHAR